MEENTELIDVLLSAGAKEIVVINSEQLSYVLKKLTDLGAAIK